MTRDTCGRFWRDQPPGDGANHTCTRPTGHDGPCTCWCGAKEEQ